MKVVQVNLAVHAACLLQYLLSRCLLSAHRTLPVPKISGLGMCMHQLCVLGGIISAHQIVTDFTDWAKLTYFGIAPCICIMLWLLSDSLTVFFNVSETAPFNSTLQSVMYCLYTSLSLRQLQHSFTKKDSIHYHEIPTNKELRIILAHSLYVVPQYCLVQRWWAQKKAESISESSAAFRSTIAEVGGVPLENTENISVYQQIMRRSRY